jgi:hypothetical protein
MILKGINVSARLPGGMSSLTKGLPSAPGVAVAGDLEKSRNRLGEDESRSNTLGETDEKTFNSYHTRNGDQLCFADLFTRPKSG